MTRLMRFAEANLVDPRGLTRTLFDFGFMKEH